MRSCPDPLQQIRVILLDSGCTDQAAEEFLQYWQNGDPGCLAAVSPGAPAAAAGKSPCRQTADRPVGYLSDWLERKSGL